MGYVLTLCIMLAVYAAAIWAMKFMKNTRLWNTLFCAFVFLTYLVFVFVIYNDVGPDDWNFTNTLPVANVSPFMFSIMPIVYFFPKKGGRYLYLLISLLSVGMLLSPVLGCIRNFAIGYKFHPHFLLDYAAHVALSLLGVYQVRSGQVSLRRSDCLVSSSIILSVATVMLILNLIFDTAFFGLSLYGKHNIYNNVLTKSSLLSAILYFAGLCAVLLLGYLTCRALSPEGWRKKGSSSSPESAE